MCFVGKVGRIRDLQLMVSTDQALPDSTALSCQLLGALTDEQTGPSMDLEGRMLMPNLACGVAGHQQSYASLLHIKNDSIPKAD